MRTVLSVSLATILALAGAGEDRPASRPRLVVVLAVDQLRADLLIRYQEAFRGGLRRLHDEGFRFDEAIVDHAPTLSIPGHSTIATGAFPRTHGFTASSFWRRGPDGRIDEFFCFDDPEAKVVGGAGHRGMSPRAMKATGLADWITAADPRAQSLAVAYGTGLAILYGGRNTGRNPNAHAYWYEPDSASFVTSDWYRDALPDWLAQFNRERTPEYLALKEWDLSVPPRWRGLAEPDAQPFEGDGVHTAFPHRFQDSLQPGADASARARRWAFETPAEIEMLFELAARGVEALDLGGDEVTDFLAVGVTVTDRTGHDYGPRSLEQLDVLLTLDRELGRFLDLLDRRLGGGGYVLVLTADHGAPNIAEDDAAHGAPGYRISKKEMQALLGRVGALVHGYQGPADALPGLIKAELEKAPFIERAMTEKELRSTGPADPVLEVYRHSYGNGSISNFPLWGATDPEVHPATFGVVAEFAEGAQLWTARSTHGGAHLHDRLVPIVFLGGGIPAGISNAPARTVDIAPTLAQLAGLPTPATVDGRALPITSPEKESIATGAP
jgi:hypothetical protein